VLVNIAVAETPITPYIDWVYMPNLTYGTPIGVYAIGCMALDPIGALQNIPGTYIYDPPNETILSAGPNQPFTVFFTPTDSIDSTTATDTIYVNVTATPNLTWTPNPLADIIYDITLGLVGDLDASATDPTNGNTVDGNSCKKMINKS
jgi:hypothetical protein